MAIIKCPECGKEISDKASVCIHCGYPISHGDIPGFSVDSEPDMTTDKTDLSDENDQKSPSKKPILWGIVAGIILLFAAGVLLMVRNRNTINNTPKEVSDLPISVSIDGISYDGTFSGEELHDAPYGECSFIFGNGTKQWTFKGIIDESGKLTGTVDKMPVSVNAGFGDTNAVYSGVITSSVPVDSIEVMDMPYKYEYDSITFSGTYSGTTINSLPEGKGEFNGNNTSDYLNYSGEWAEGKMGESGTLKSNHATIHFSDLDRTGKYEGDVVNGVLEGEGVFSATTDDGVNYTYKGSFLNGLFDGQGSQIYDDETWYPHIGHFKKGEFEPTLVEALSSISQRKVSSCNIPSFKLNFFEKNPALFTKGTVAEANTYLNKDFRIADFAKNPASDTTKIAKISMRIFQVIEDEMWGYNFTRVLGSKGSNIYFCYYFGKSDKLADNRSVTLYVMPLDYSTYKGIDGSDYWAAFSLISCVG